MRGEKEKGTWREGDEHRESTDKRGRWGRVGRRKKVKISILWRRKCTEGSSKVKRKQGAWVGRWKPFLHIHFSPVLLYTLPNGGANEKANVLYCAIRLDINDLYPHFQYWYSTGNSPGYSQLLSGHPVFCLIHTQAAPSSKPYKVFREERRLLVLTVYCC